MATVTVSASANYATLGHAADDDIVITGAATLTVNSDPTAINAPRSIRSSSARATLRVRNTATAFSAGNLWKLSFTNPGSAIGAGGTTIGMTSGATLDIEGEWLVCYTATGVASETVLDASNVLGVDIDFPYFIEAETSAGSGVYKAVPVAVIGSPGNGFLTTVAQSAFGTGDVGRVLFYDHSTRLLKTGDGTNGSLFASGIKFRIPNIYVHMPAFTLAVAAGGWTTATGAQNVVSSTGAPVVGAGNVNYVAGVECFNISAAPSGTTVTVNNRGSDGTTATAHAAGTVLYALPAVASTMAGRVTCNSNGIIRLRRCWFSRWMIPQPASGIQWDSEDVGYVSQVSDGNGFNLQTMNGLTRLIRGVIYGCPGRGAQIGLRAGAQLGLMYLDSVLCVVQASAASTSSYTSAQTITQISGAYTLQTCAGLRIWRMGLTTGMNTFARSFSLSSSSPASGTVPNLELIGCGADINASDFTMPGMRFSVSNGALTTADVTAVTLGNSVPTANITINDFDIASGGVAPYRGWFDLASNAKNCKIHNKVSGSVRSIDSQARTQLVIPTFNGTGNLLASMAFTNLRGTGQIFAGSFNGSNNAVRNCRSAMSGVLMGIEPLLSLDFPPGPIAGNPISSWSDTGTFYAAPNTYPSLVGGIYLGPVSIESALDQYELTAGAYTNTQGDFFVETTGDAVLFKSPKRITGVSSITGSAVVYSSHSNITTGVTAEFRLCKWGDDITAVSWGSFTAGNVQTAFNALSGYTTAGGLDFQLRFTATTTVAGRFIRQCYVPCQMDTAYNPAVGQVNVTALGAANGGLMAVYDGSGALQGTATIASGTGTVQGPYDFDGSATTYTLKIRALEAESIDITSTYGQDGALVPAPMPALSGYVAGPDTGVTWTKVGSRVDPTVTANMSNQDLWSRYRRFIVQLANFDIADAWSYSGGVLNLGSSNITVSGADLTGDLVTTGTATQASGGRFIGVVQAGNGSSGVLTVSGLTGASAAAQVYVEDDAGVQQDFQTAVTGSHQYPTPFGSSGVWKLVVNKPGYYPQTFGFNPQISNSYSVTLLPILNPDGTELYTGGTWPIVVTFDVPTNCVATFGTQVSVQALFDALQDGYSTADGMAWLANDNAESTASIQATGHTLNLTPRTRLAGDLAPAAVAGYVTSQDDTVLDPASPFPIRYAQSPSDAGTAPVETGFDIARSLRVISAAVAGKTTGGPAGFTARNLSDTADQITGTADGITGDRIPTSYGS